MDFYDKKKVEKLCKLGPKTSPKSHRKASQNHSEKTTKKSKKIGTKIIRQGTGQRAIFDKWVVASLQGAEDTCNGARDQRFPSSAGPPPRGRPRALWDSLRSS